MSLTVERAGLERLERIVPLFDAYRQFYGQPSDPDGARAFLTERMSRGESVILVAVLPDEPQAVVGFAQLYPLFTSVGMRRVWLLNDLFVAPEHRRSGAGRLLLTAAHEFAASTGASQLRLSTAKDNADAKRLYEQEGYRLDDAFDHYVLHL